MKHIQVEISDINHRRLVDYKLKRKLKKLDDAVEEILNKFFKKVKKDV